MFEEFSAEFSLDFPSKSQRGSRQKAGSKPSACGVRNGGFTELDGDAGVCQ